MQDIELIAFCDKVVGQVTEFHGYRVIRVEDIVRDYGDAAVLITPVNENLKKEIIKQYNTIKEIEEKNKREVEKIKKTKTDTENQSQILDRAQGVL